MSFPKSFIDEIKYKNNISDVIGKYVVLKRSGSNLHGLCPFHSEKTPSFTVFGDHYHCFGCGASGDVITFVMQTEGMTYLDAIRSLADRAGIPMPPEDGRIQSVSVKKPVLSRERAFELNTAAARIFHANLALPEAQQARAYFEKRGLDRATIRHFGLGYALDSFDDLLKKLRAKGFRDDEIKECSLCAISQKGTYYDYFRNRVMFPIIDTDGKVVAFGGRVMDDSKPKYLNSSDTPVFKKSRTLFALNFAMNAARGDSDDKTGAGRLIMCEGYMDVISLHQAGFCGAVATLGTAVTPEHARRISRYAKTVYLAYDSDGAGKNATNKAIKLLEEAGIEAKALKITGAKDPDEFIKKYGGAAFSKLLTGAVGQTDYSLGEILGKYDIDDPDDKAKAISEACGMLSAVYPLYRREIYIQRLAEMTGVSRENIEHETSRRERQNRKEEAKALTVESTKAARFYNDTVNPDASKNPKCAAIEERILGIILLYPELMPSEDALSPDDFVTDFNRRVFERIRSLCEEGDFDISELNEYFSANEVSRIFGMREARMCLSSNGKVALAEQIKALKDEKEEMNNKALSFDDKLNAIRKKKLDKGGSQGT